MPQLKRFEASSLALVYEAIRDELGDEAVIVSTRVGKRPALFGLRQKEFVEVVAHVPDAAVESVPFAQDAAAHDLVRGVAEAAATGQHLDVRLPSEPLPSIPRPAAAEADGAAILAIPITGTVKRVSNQKNIEETVAREGLWEAQTPQVFRRELLMEAHAQKNASAATDDAQLVERLGHPVRVVTGSPLNLKISTKSDMRMAEMALKALPKPRLDGPAHPFSDGDMWR